MSSVIKEMDRREINALLKRWYFDTQYETMVSAFRYFSNTVYMVDIDCERVTHDDIAELHNWIISNVEPNSCAMDYAMGCFWFREREIAMQFYLTWGTAFSR